MALQLLIDLTVVLGAAVLIAYVFARLHLPAIVGLFVAGVLIGPDALGLIAESEEIEAVAEIGVVLLLFTIGIEFSLSELVRIRDLVFLGGVLQMGLTAAVGMGVSYAFGLTLEQALFLGLVLALSSTAITLKILQQRAEVDAPHGRNAVGILIFQDLMVVPLTLLVPLLAGNAEVETSPLVVALEVVGLILFVLVATKWVVPWILKELARLQSPEVFLIGVLVMCFGVAAVSGWIGLSVALGAFVAGLVISESEYSHQALGNVMPFRDVLVSFFFVSVGLLLDLHFLLEHWWLLLLAASSVILGKAVLGTVAVLALRFPLRTAVLAGVSLAQVGEFSFVLLQVGAVHGLVSDTVRQGFLALAVLTMAATPILIAQKERLADRLVSLPLPERLIRGQRAEMESPGESLRDHLVIVGFGVNGRNVARAARRASIPYTVLELNPETVRRERKRGESIVFGDATNAAVLDEVGVPFARVGAVVINDPVATRRIVAQVRRANPNIHLLARTRYISEVQALLDLGADEVVPEEFETAIEIFSRTLQQYLVPEAVIARTASEIRADGYGLLRRPLEDAQTWRKVESALPGLEIATLRVADDVPAAGRTLSDLDLRRRYGVTLLAVRRDGEITSNPDGEMQIQAGDIVVLLGSPEATIDARTLFAVCGEGAVC
jgi:monovalent cation:H+ antiporter-2, CPA2 family